MRKLSFLLTVAMFCSLIAMFAFAGDEMTPPPPLDNAHLKWMIGEWEGTTTSSYGETKDWMSCEMGLNDQFVMMNYKGQMGPMTFVGMGALTQGQDGSFKGMWIDSFRSLSMGTGMLEGNKMTMTWDSPEGPYTRVTEKVSDDKMVVTFKMTGPDGKDVPESVGRTEMTRVKKMGKK